VTAKQALAQLAAMGDAKQMHRLMGNALRRAASRIRTAASKAIRSKGVGRTLWGGGGRFKKNVKGSRALLKIGKVERSGGTTSITITAKGFPALMEQGGRTKAHIIESQRTRRLRVAATLEQKGRKNTAAFLRGAESRGLLAFRTGGRLAFATRVKHPGSHIPAQPSVGPQIEANVQKVEQELVNAVNDHIAAASRPTGEFPLQRVK